GGARAEQEHRIPRGDVERGAEEAGRAEAVAVLQRLPPLVVQLLQTRLRGGRGRGQNAEKGERRVRACTHGRCAGAPQAASRGLGQTNPAASAHADYEPGGSISIWRSR